MCKSEIAVCVEPCTPTPHHLSALLCQGLGGPRAGKAEELLLLVLGPDQGRYAAELARFCTSVGGLCHAQLGFHQVDAGESTPSGAWQEFAARMAGKGGGAAAAGAGAWLCALRSRVGAIFASVL